MQSKILISVLLLSSIVGGCAQGVANTDEKRVHHYVLIDVSKSSPIFELEFRKKAAKDVAGEIENLLFGSRVSVHTFATFDGEEKSWEFMVSAKKSKHASQREIANHVQALVLRIPQLVSEGQKTSLLGFFAKRRFDAPCRMTIVSDFLEDSEVRITDILRNPSGKLPEMPGVLLPACSVRALGFGRGLKKEKDYKRLVQIWTEWFRIANPSGTVELKS